MQHRIHIVLIGFTAVTFGINTQLFCYVKNDGLILTKQSNLNIHSVAVLEPLIISRDLHQQIEVLSCHGIVNVLLTVFFWALKRFINRVSKYIVAP